MDSSCSTPAVSYLLYATNLCVDLTLDEAEPSSEYATCSSLCEWETDSCDDLHRDGCDDDPLPLTADAL